MQLTLSLCLSVIRFISSGGGGGGSSPSADFSDAANSQYVALLLEDI